MMNHYNFSVYDGNKGREKYRAAHVDNCDIMTKPSAEVVRNILNYARCTQCITVKNRRLRLYLN